LGGFAGEKHDPLAETRHSSLLVVSTLAAKRRQHFSDAGVGSIGKLVCLHIITF
jgi:hypothetical protein